MFCKFLVFHSHAGRLCLLSLKIFATRTRALHKPRFAPVYFPLCRPTLCSVLHTTGIRWQRPLRFAQLTILLAQLFCTSLVSFIGSFFSQSRFFAANLGFFAANLGLATARAGNTTTCPNTRRAIQPGSNQSCKSILLFFSHLLLKCDYRGHARDVRSHARDKTLKFWLIYIFNWSSTYIIARLLSSYSTIFYSSRRSFSVSLLPFVQTRSECSCSSTFHLDPPLGCWTFYSWDRFQQVGLPRHRPLIWKPGNYFCHPCVFKEDQTKATSPMSRKEIDASWRRSPVSEIHLLNAVLFAVLCRSLIHLVGGSGLPMRNNPGRAWRRKLKT